MGSAYQEEILLYVYQHHAYVTFKERLWGRPRARLNYSAWCDRVFTLSSLGWLVKCGCGSGGVAGHWGQRGTNVFSSGVWSSDPDVLFCWAFLLSSQIASIVVWLQETAPSSLSVFIIISADLLSSTLTDRLLTQLHCCRIYWPTIKTVLTPSMWKLNE